MKPIDDDEARRLLAPLAEEPPADPRVDVAEAMRRGSRIRRDRRIAGGATAVAVAAVMAGAGLAVLRATAPPDVPVAAGSASASTSAAPPPAPGDRPAAPEGAACRTGDFPDAGAVPSVTDRSGRWTVSSRAKDQAPLLWRDGALVGPVPVDAAPLQAFQVNAAGSIAATSYEPTRPWASVGGTPTPLNGGEGYATAVSESGRFGGSLGGRPVVWESPDAEPAPLPLPSGYTAGEVVAFGDDGKTVLGTIGTGASVRITQDGATGTGVLWLPGGGTRLLPVPEGSEWVRPTAMRGDWVVGLASDGSAFRYRVPDDRIELLPAQITWPVAVASDGAVAGVTAFPPVVFARGYRPVLLSGDEIRSLRPGDPSDALYELSGLTDDGRVTGYAMTAGTGRAFVSTCD